MKWIDDKIEEYKEKFSFGDKKFVEITAKLIEAGYTVDVNDPKTATEVMMEEREEQMEALVFYWLRSALEEAYEAGAKSRAGNCYTLTENKAMCPHLPDDPDTGCNFCGANQVECSRCNDNGCPSCDGTRGSKYNPEPY